MSHDPAEFPVAREPWDCEPGETVRLPRHFTDHGQDLTCFDEGHTIADVLRWLIAESDYEEVLHTLETMRPL